VAGGRTGGGDRAFGRRQDHAAAGAGLRAAARTRALSAGWPDPWRLPAAQACAPARPAVPGAAGAARCRRASASSPPCWPAGCRPSACGQPALAVLSGRHPGAYQRAGSLRPGRQALRACRPTVRRRTPARRPGARAAVAGPLWLIDEPLSALDPTRAQPGLATLVTRHASAAPRWWPRCTRWTWRWRTFRASSVCATGRWPSTCRPPMSRASGWRRLYAQHEDELQAARRPADLRPDDQSAAARPGRAPVVMHCRREHRWSRLMTSTQPPPHPALSATRMAGRVGWSGAAMVLPGPCCSGHRIPALGRCWRATA
jgi:hypothetical protein